MEGGIHNVQKEEEEEEVISDVVNVRREREREIGCAREIKFIGAIWREEW